MKKLIFVIILAALFGTNGKAVVQTCNCEYHPCIVKGKTWKFTELCRHKNDTYTVTRFSTVSVVGQEERNGKTCWVLCRTYSNEELPAELQMEDQYTYVYEEGNKVWEMWGSELVPMLDFGVKTGDFPWMKGTTTYSDMLNVMGEDTIWVKGHARRRIAIGEMWFDHNEFNSYWVEGIGPSENIVLTLKVVPIENNEQAEYVITYPHLVSVYQDGELIFEFDDFATTNVVHGNETGEETGIACQSQRPGQRQLHDLQGRRLTEAPERGMYIQDGKVMMK